MGLSQLRRPSNRYEDKPPLGYERDTVFLSRRQFLIASSATAVSALLAACGGDDEAPPTSAPVATQPAGGAAAPTTAAAAGQAPATGASPTRAAAPTQSTLQPKMGGTFVHPIDTDPPFLLSSFAVGTTDNYVGNKTYEPLLRYTMDTKYEGVLAKSWEASPDGITWTFKLQQGVKWHDGKPFTSQDVKFTFETLAKNQSRTKSIPDALDTIETPDDTTAVFKFKKPLGPLLTLLTATNGCIGPKHLLDGTDLQTNAAIKDIAVGTGPFKMTKRDRGQQVVYEKNKEYWQPGKPYLDGIITPIMPDPQARVLAFEAGDVDYIPDIWLPKEQYLRLSKLPGNKGFEGGGLPGVNFVALNLRRDIMKDKKVRQAIYQGIDRQFIIDKVWFGLAVPLKSHIPQELGWSYNPEIDLTKMYPYDPAAAKKLLDEAGYPVKSGGIRFTLSGVYDSGRAGYQALFEVFKAQMKDIGIDLQNTAVDRQGYQAKVFDSWDYDFTYLSYGTFGDPTSGIQRTFLTSNAGKGSFNNVTNYSNPTVDDLFSRAASGATQEERQKLFFEVQKILADEIPTLPLDDGTNVYIAKDYVMGFWHAITDEDEWSYVWLNK